ncbi:hypothetical protein D3C71_1959070 [compost metagenome]
MSARMNSSLTDEPVSGRWMALPTLAVETSVRPSTGKGRSAACTTAWAIRSTVAGFDTLSRMMTNSSPPMRATASPLRTQVASRSAKDTSRRSPTGWP